MGHDEWFESISADVDGELDGDELAALVDHLAECRGCSDLHADLLASRRRSLLRVAAPGGHLVEDVLVAREAQRRQADRARATLVRRSGLVAGAVAAAALGLALLPRGASPDRTVQPREQGATLIAAHDRSFDSADIEVPAGTTVEWRNSGSTTHHLVRQLGAATVDEDLPPGRTESVTFDEAGTYEYYCTIHPEMSGTVTVDA